VTEAHELTAAAQLLEALRSGLAGRGARARVAAFTSATPGEDLVLLGTEQEADLLLLEAPAELVERGSPSEELALVLAEMPCDVALAAFRGDGTHLAAGPERPVLVPFGGAEHEWAAVEIAAWIARAYGARLKLLGTQADPSSGRRDASRLLARAALMIQRVAAVPTEPELIAPGTRGVLEAAGGAGLVVVGLSERWREEGLGSTRRAVLRDAPVSTPCSSAVACGPAGSRRGRRSRGSRGRPSMTGRDTADRVPGRRYGIVASRVSPAAPLMSVATSRPGAPLKLSPPPPPVSESAPLAPRRMSSPLFTAMTALRGRDRVARAAA
jgi:hypothetical protein